jgi:F0F1-type ATP synthase assembly protein I
VAKKPWPVMVAEYTTLAFVLPVCAFVGYILGYLLDKEFETGWIYIAGLILGIVAGFVQLLRQLRRDTRDGENL